MPRPYIWRLTSLSLVIWPSVWPFDQPEVMALLAELDSYLASLYEPEANHILDVHQLLQPEIAFYVARDEGRPVGTAAYRRMAQRFGALISGGSDFHGDEGKPRRANRSVFGVVVLPPADFARLEERAATSR